MFRFALLALSLLSARCAPSSPPTVDEACMDTWLSAHGLDVYGNPAGIRYAGGSPLVDEATGHARTREEYVLALHPELAAACLTPPST